MTIEIILVRNEKPRNQRVSIFMWINTRYATVLNVNYIQYVGIACMN